MKSKSTTNSRSEHARNEERDSQGRFKSSDSSKTTTNSSKNGNSSESRSERARKEPRDSQGRFKSTDSK